jgi:hypothetical protein
VSDHLFGGTAASSDDVRGGWLVPYLVLAGTLGVVVIVRRPDAILNAQFWAEDNTLFFQQLTLGFWAALRRLYAGFPYLDHRLIALLASELPLSRVPLAYNVIVIAITALMIATFSLPSFRHLVRNDRLRAAVCLGTVCMPAGQELLATLTNVGFFLCIWLVFLSVMRAPTTLGGVAGWCLGGAFAVFSSPGAPVAAPLWGLRAVYGLRKRRRPDVAFAATQTAALLAIVAMAGTGSAGILKTLPAEPPAMEWHVGYLWSAFAWLGWVTAAHVDAALLPPAAFSRLEALGGLPVYALALVVTVALALAMRDLLARGRVTVGLAIYLLVASLYLVLAGRPVIVQLLRGEVLPNLRLRTLQIVGPRHLALANVAILLAVAGIVDGARRIRTRIAAASVACLALLVAWAPQFRVPPFPDLHWPAWAARLEQKVESGSREPLVIPSFPPGYEIRLDATVRGSASSAADDPRAEP